MDEKNEIRELLLEKAKISFYEKGYQKTSFEYLANECGVTKPTISYYFKNKVNLANEVYSRYISTIRKLISERIMITYGTQDFLTVSAVQIRMLLEMYHQDKNAYRFYHELINCGFTSFSVEPSLNYNRLIHQQYHLDIDENIDEVQLLTYAIRGAATSLVVAFFDGNLNCTYEQFMKYRLTIVFKIMNLPETKIEQILEDADKIIQDLNFKIKPYFLIV